MASTLVEHIDLACAEKQLQIVQYGTIEKMSVDPYTTPHLFTTVVSVRVQSRRASNS